MQPGGGKGWRTSKPGSGWWGWCDAGLSRFGFDSARQRSAAESGRSGRGEGGDGEKEQKGRLPPSPSSRRTHGNSPRVMGI